MLIGLLLLVYILTVEYYATLKKNVKRCPEYIIDLCMFKNTVYTVVLLSN